MSTDELRLHLLTRIAQCVDPLTLATVLHVLNDEAASTDDYRPDSGKGADVSSSELGTTGNADVMLLREDGAQAHARDEPTLQVGEGEALGVRSDGSMVAAGEASVGWDEAVQEVLAGGGYTGEQLLKFIEDRPDVHGNV